MWWFPEAASPWESLSCLQAKISQNTGHKARAKGRVAPQMLGVCRGAVSACGPKDCIPLASPLPEMNFGHTPAPREPAWPRSSPTPPQQHHFTPPSPHPRLPFPCLGTAALTCSSASAMAQPGSHLTHREMRETRPWNPGHSGKCSFSVIWAEKFILADEPAGLHFGFRVSRLNGIVLWAIQT